MKLTEAECAHRTLLEKWRPAMNLVGPGPVDPHFEDAAGVVDGLKVQGSWVDLGSGAGFPGIALAARHPDATVTLVESREKRVAFLRAVVHATGLTNVRIFHGRTDAVEPGFDGVISRAYRPPEAYLEDTHRLLSTDGVAVLMSGEPPESLRGWAVQSTHRYAVGDQTRVRTVLIRD